jgi:hypothetical protein
MVLMMHMSYQTIYYHSLQLKVRKPLLANHLRPCRVVDVADEVVMQQSRQIKFVESVSGEFIEVVARSNCAPVYGAKPLNNIVVSIVKWLRLI